ncbi:MAG: WecB/TagA/CpsF family glycosyltransferase [Clostridia bacterium]|nr:WecB/TagA/CpsF family glycosyltransferase [Clostridia bacterium]
MRNRVNILGIRFDNLDARDALSWCERSLNEKKKGYIVTPNAEFVYACRQNETSRTLINNAALVTPDGIGVVYAGKILGTPVKDRVPGCDLAESLAASMARSGHTLYLLGAKPGVAEKAAENMKVKHPGLKIVGTHDGYFKDAEPVLEDIRRTAPDVVFVCLGFPKQEQFMADHLQTLPCTLMLGLGGSLDVFAGVVNRAPEIYQKLGMEWFYRLCQEPKRIKRMAKLPLFLLIAVKERLLHGKSRQEDPQ